MDELCPLTCLVETLNSNIFLGETFSSYISVHNDSNMQMRDVVVKAELQTSSQRITLSDMAAKAQDTLLPAASVDVVVHHEVKELGVHMCAFASVHFRQQ